MALQGSITGINQLYFGGQTALTAIFTNTETGQTPAGLQYAWTASDGSFVGATNGASVTYHADFTGNTDQAVTIACEVTLPGNPNPTVSAPSLTVMDELGITGQLVNMLVTTEVSGADLFDRTDDTAIATGSDSDLTDDIRINRIRWTTNNRFTLNKTGSGEFRNFWDTAAQSAYSGYVIVNDGTVLELLGTWIVRGGGYMRWEVPSSETAVINALDSIENGQLFLFGIADTDSVGLPDETASTDATVTVRYNAPPNVTITAPQKVNPGDTVPISVTAVDPEDRAVTVQWEATDGTIDNPTSLNPNFTASNQSGPVTLTCVATDADGVEGSNTHVIVVNFPPTVVITAPSRLEVSRTGNISIVVSDPNNDTVTTLLETSAGSIDNPTSLNAVITAPSTPQTVTVTCTATDVDGLQTVETAQITIIPNQPPTLSITVPNALEIGQTGNLRATVGDPTNDPVTIRWEASAGAIGNRTALNTTITVPATPQTITVTCIATDDRGATTTATATITVRQPNRPPTVTLNVPAKANPGQTVNIEAIVDDLDGDDTEGEWRSPKGRIANSENKSTTFTAPLETGVVPITYEAMDDMGATTAKTAYITVGDPKANIYTPAVRIEIEGVDMTKRWIKRDGMIVGKQLDYPNTSRFRSSEIRFNVDNEDGYFDYSNPNNFFVANGLPAHGRGAKVLVRLGLSASELTPVFGGIISELVTSLGDTKAQITLHDLSQKLSRTDVKSFGEEITRKITDFDGVNGDYDDLDPVFYFPWWGLPIARNSVSLVVHPEDGTDIDINIVDTIATSGMLSNARAEVDYNRGLIRFEAPPTDGADTEITATWKVDYKYKRPDFLIRQLLKHSGIQSELGITDEKAARFGIEQALISHPTNESFSSHGRPYAQENGVVRWLKREVRNGTPIWQMIQDQRFVEYDEHQDEYTKVATLPEDSGLDGVVNTDYGVLLPDESFDLSDAFVQGATVNPRGVAVTDSRIYILNNFKISAFLLDLTPVTSEDTELDEDYIVSQNGGELYYVDIDVYDGDFYVAYFHNNRFASASDSAGWRVIDIESGVVSTTYRVQNRRSMNVTQVGIAVNSTRVFFDPGSNLVSVHEHDGVEIASETTLLKSALGTNNPRRLAVNDTHIFGFRTINSVPTVVVCTLSYVADPDASITLESESHGFYANNTRFYSVNRYTNMLDTYQLGVAVNFGGYVPYQFATADNNAIFFIAANNTQGNALSATALRRIKVFKYTKSTGMWTDILNETTGQPQLSHAYKLGGVVTYLAENRKNFQVIQHNNKTLVFYRRVRATASGVAYYNDNDGSVTDVYSENHSGSEDYGLPYSMDFALDVRSDGIYVYTFVVRYTFESDGDYNGGTLKVYRKRVEPSATQTEIYSETFTKSVDEEDYPVSVSDLILADNRSKFYFVLDWHGEAERAGKSELCTIAKSGSGSRTVIKTYDNPLVGARSPVERNGSYLFYLEGGWVRQSKDDPLDELIPDDQHHYPNQGGTLIEIASDDTITDHGQVWRSATKQDSPDPENEDGVYDGWGLHNAVLSNMIVDGRGNLHFVAGYGSPYNISENLPFSSNREPVPALSNYHWLQWGKDLSTKIASFPTTDVKAWDLIEQLAQLMGWEIGFGPGVRKVDAIQAAHAGITDWGANASFFFRPRTILPAHLRNSISGSGTLSAIALNDMGLPAEASEFPVPPAGERYAVIIDKELFTYTNVMPDSQGRRLTGVMRAQNGSVNAAHSVDAAVYFVDYFASGELGTTLVSIQNKSVDFVNLRNDVNVNYGEAVYPTKNQRSIDENGEFTFDLQNSLLSKYDQVWAELIGDTYLDELSDLKELLQATLVFSPMLQPGQLVVVYQLDRVRIEFKLFRLLQAQHHTHPRWQTGVTALEIIPGRGQ